MVGFDESTHSLACFFGIDVQRIKEFADMGQGLNSSFMLASVEITCGESLRLKEKYALKLSSEYVTGSERSFYSIAAQWYSWSLLSPQDL